MRIAAITSFFSDEFPASLKLSQVISLFRRRHALSFLKESSKLYIHSKSVENLSVIDSSRHRSLKCKSTNMYEFGDGVLNSLRKKLKLTGIFAGLSMAIYIVHHNILTNNLNYYGNKGNVFSFVNSYVNENGKVSLLC